MDVERPKVGVGVIVLNAARQVMLLKRLNSHGEGMWGGAGGHLENGESFEDCARRETLEELGVTIRNVRLASIANLTSHPPKHYVDIGFVADLDEGEPQRMEPEKCAEIGWFDLDVLPTPLFGFTQQYVDAHRNGRVYCDHTLTVAMSTSDSTNDPIGL